jgi:hypothetical protein
LVFSKSSAICPDRVENGVRFAFLPIDSRTGMLTEHSDLFLQNCSHAMSFPISHSLQSTTRFLLLATVIAVPAFLSSGSA